MKYAFNHDEESLSAAIGIAKAREEEIYTIAIDVATRAYLTDNKIDTESKAFEVLINQIDPKNHVEAFYAAFCFAKAGHKIKALAKDFL